ncbi:MAG: fumarate reductase/succinate dehydrogenase flavoprotein subunit [Polyangia bacterium]
MSTSTTVSTSPSASLSNNLSSSAPIEPKPPAGTRLDAHIPPGALPSKWSSYRSQLKLINPANKRKFNVIVVGSGLAGASAAATLAELGYQVDCFCFQDSPRRAHSIAAQGGINAAKNYQNDGDSVYRLFYDTVKGGDFRAREANVYRLAEVSTQIIDHCVAQGVPFARDYGGTLANRSFGGAQVSRTFYARGQTGQQLLLGAYAALCRQIDAGKVRMHTRTEMLDLVLVNGRARGIITRDLTTGKIERYAGHAVLLATGGYGNVFYLSTNAAGCNVTATYRAHRRGALFANPCFTQIHPTCIPVAGEHQSKLTLMSESLRNDGRIWVPKKPGDTRNPADIPEDERDYYLERMYPSYGNLSPRDIASRAAKRVCDEGRGVGPAVGGERRGVYLDFSDAIARLGKDTIRQRYGNLFEMYEKITGEDPYVVPMRIYPASHYTMGGLWVDYNLMSNVPGLHVLGEANFSDHGANRLGASALMQGLADGYFIIPYTLGAYFASTSLEKVGTDHAAFDDAEKQVREQIDRLLGLASKGKRSPDSFHRELGALIWEHCGMARNQKGLAQALRRIPELREEFWQSVRVLGTGESLNQQLEKAGRVADFFDFAELMCLDAYTRAESCGGHFREEFQTEEGEALRNDNEFCHASCWEYRGTGVAPTLIKEPLVFENVKLTQRSYK